MRNLQFATVILVLTIIIGLLATFSGPQTGHDSYLTGIILDKASTLLFSPK